MKIRKIVLILLAAIILVIVFFVFRSKSVQTERAGPVPSLEKKTPTVLVTKDKDGYGLQILARGFKNVRKVEMLVKYQYRGKENPSLVASGTPQQDSYWAHFRFESCSRGDCVRFKTDQADFRLTLNYEDGESREYQSPVKLADVSQETPISLNP